MVHSPQTRRRFEIDLDWDEVYPDDGDRAVVVAPRVTTGPGWRIVAAVVALLAVVAWVL